VDDLRKSCHSKTAVNSLNVRAAARAAGPVGIAQFPNWKIGDTLLVFLDNAAQGDASDGKQDSGLASDEMSPISTQLFPD